MRNLGNEKRRTGARGAGAAATGPGAHPGGRSGREDTRGRARGGCTAAVGSARLCARGEGACVRPRERGRARVRGARRASCPRVWGRSKSAQPPHLAPVSSPKSRERGGPRAGLWWSWNFRSRSLPTPLAPGGPWGRGTRVGTPGSRGPLPFLHLRSRRRRRGSGGLARGLGGPGGGSGRGGRSRVGGVRGLGGGERGE